MPGLENGKTTRIVLVRSVCKNKDNFEIYNFLLISHIAKSHRPLHTNPYLEAHKPKTNPSNAYTVNSAIDSRGVGRGGGGVGGVGRPPLFGGKFYTFPI